MWLHAGIDKSFNTKVSNDWLSVVLELYVDWWLLKTHIKTAMLNKRNTKSIPTNVLLYYLCDSERRLSQQIYASQITHIKADRSFQRRKTLSKKKEKKKRWMKNYTQDEHVAHWSKACRDIVGRRRVGWGWGGRAVLTVQVACHRCCRRRASGGDLAECGGPF